MKIAFLCIAAVAAQYKPTKGNSRHQARDAAIKWCDKWIVKSFSCKPPIKKIEKFKDRFQKVVDDAIWHYEGAKRCTVKGKDSSKPYRKRRNDYQEEYYGEYYDEYDGDYADSFDESVGRSLSTEGPADEHERAMDVQTLGAKCTQALGNFFDHEDLAGCRKLGSWTRRANGLVGQVTTMMFLCMQDAMNNPAGGGYRVYSESTSMPSPFADDE